MRELIRGERCVVLRFDRGDEVVSALTGWFESPDAPHSALICGAIGMLQDPEIGAYRPEGYDRKIMKGALELLSLSGNVSMKQGKPFPHIHVVLGRHDMSTCGGHLFSAGVAVTVEMSLVPLVTEELIRLENHDIPGFWQLDAEDG